MVYVNLCKLLLLINSVNDCPVGVPSRNEKLFDAYCLFKQTSNSVVSIEVSSELERAFEANLDDEDVPKRRKIINELIKIYTNNRLTVPQPMDTVYLVPQMDSCPKCQEKLVTLTPHRGRTGVLIFTKGGPRTAETWNKQCKG